MTLNGILIVDDDPVVCLALKEQLLEEGYRVQTACRGSDALRILGKKQFDLAYVNLIMDPMDGIETARRLKQIDPRMKIVLMSGLHEELEMRKQEAFQVGECDMIIDKPITLDIGRFTKKVLKKNFPKRGGRGKYA
ncbi:MAG: response regulator [Deltaproteobacteria bacterium]|nr:response regulator [Deltaproteobacteria bacterium]